MKPWICVQHGEVDTICTFMNQNYCAQCRVDALKRSGMNPVQINPLFEEPKKNVKPTIGKDKPDDLPF